MYQPPHFAVDDPETLERFIAEHPLGLMISAVDGTIEVNPVPFLLRRGDGGLTLLAHVARANNHWKLLQQSPSVVVVFQGEQAYISPSWYASKAEHHKVVPTWNYVIVEARGEAIVHDDPAWLHAQITALTDRHEENRETGWSVSDAPERFIDVQKRGIVGLEIRVRQLTGKWKMSQNRPVADRQGVHDGLIDDGKPEVASLVARHGGLTSD